MSNELEKYNFQSAGGRLRAGGRTVIFLALYFIISSISEPLDRQVVGDPVDLKFISLDGRQVDVSALSGKVVLIDCWATWCRPCLEEIPNIKKLYEKYNNKGFEVIGITMDGSTSRERVVKFLQQKAIPWPQRFEGKGFQEDSFRKQYGIKSLPTVYLLDKKGIIVDENARGERLESLILKYLER